MVAFKQHEFIQYREELSSSQVNIWRGLVFMRDDPDPNYVWANTKFALELKETYKKNTSMDMGFEIRLYRPWTAPDKYFVPKPSRDTTTSPEQKARDINLHAWTYATGFCNKPPDWLLRRHGKLPPLPEKPVESDFVGKKVGRRPGCEQFAFHIYNEWNGTTVTNFGVVDKIFPDEEFEGEILKEFIALTPITHRGDWEGKLRTGRENTFYTVLIVKGPKHLMGKRFTIHESRVEVCE